jgi:hypothetical protein
MMQSTDRPASKFLFPKLPHTETLLDDNTKDSAITLHHLVEGKRG